MRIDIYNTYRSIKPMTSWKSSADMHNFLEENGNIASICKKIKETGDKSLKAQLPAMMPMGSVGDLTRKKENCTPTGIVMVDIDKTLSPNPSPVKGEGRPCGEEGGEKGGEFLSREEMLGWVEKMKPELERLHVVLIHITPSARGLRLLAHCHADGMEATVKRLEEDLKLGEFGHVDPACKDLSRLSYLVPADYIVYEKGLFDEVPQVSIDAMKNLQWTGAAEKGINVSPQVGEVIESDERCKDFEYNGFKVAEIVKEYVASTGGDPVGGTVHTFYNKLVVMFRNICNNDPKIVHAVLPRFGHSIEETWNQCCNICSSNRTTKIDSKLYFWLRDHNMLAQRTIAENEEEQKAEPLPPMPALPPIFRQYVNAAPEDFKIPTVIALLPILGTLTSHLRSRYFDDSEQSTEFISLLFAPPSSGKSFIKRLSGLLQNLRDRDEISNAREAVWAETMKNKGANDKGEEQPHVSVRIVKPLISIPELLTKMRYNQGHHMYIEAEELDTFAKGNKSSGGDKSDLWRVIDRFFKNVEDGLVTRFSVCPIENQTFAKFVPWKPIPQKDKLQIQNILNRLEMKNYKMPLKFDKSELVDIKKEEFDTLVPWQYEFQPFEHVDLSYLYPTLLNWLEEERIKAAQSLDEARDVFRRRAAVKGFRLALVCHGLYANVTKKEQKVITEFVKWFCTVDLRNSLYQFGQRYNELQQNVTKVNQPIHNKVFDKMGDAFTRSDLRIALQRAGVKSPVKVVLYMWKKNKLIRNENDMWYKVKK